MRGIGRRFLPRRAVSAMEPGLECVSISDHLAENIVINQKSLRMSMR